MEFITATISVVALVIWMIFLGVAMQKASETSLNDPWISIIMISGFIGELAIFTLGMVIAFA